MKSLRNICGVIFLSLLLSASAIAGDMPGGFIGDPPPPSQQLSASDTTNSTSSNSASATVDPVTETVLNVLQSVLAVLG